jgi:hypothetical protein
MDSQEPSPTGEFILYTTEDGKSRVECRFENETIWLSQALIAELFETTPQNITLHLKALVEDGEIDPEATCKDYLQVRSEGRRVRVRNDRNRIAKQKFSIAPHLTPSLFLVLN